MYLHSFRKHVCRHIFIFNYQIIKMNEDQQNIIIFTQYLIKFLAIIYCEKNVYLLATAIST